MTRVLLIVGLVALVAPRAAGAQACTHDDGLARVAAELALDGRRPSPRRLAELLRSEDTDRVAAHMLWLTEPDAPRVDAWLAELASRADGALVCGRAESADLEVWVASERAAGLNRATDGRLIASLDPGYTDPYLVFRGAGGELMRRALSAGDRARGFGAPEGLAAPIVVQLVATGPSGPRPVAERVLGAVDAAASGPDVQAGTSVPGFVADLRELRRAPPLRPNRLLDRVAEGYARRVCASGRVVHGLGEGDPEARLRREGIAARVVGEAAALAEDVPTALESLADSPSHLMALVDRRFTDVGHGVAADARGRRCVVVLLAAWPRPTGRLAAR